ncbi:MAG: BTAD domain-containing putative transcriptional regulator [Caldilineaceae bacterium]
MTLAFQLLGAVQISWQNQPLKFSTEHSRALLAYLAVEADIAHRRTTLATLLWPEENESTARHNLRQALFFLKKSLAVVPQRDDHLQITPTTVQWQSQGVTVDLRIFQTVWDRGQAELNGPQPPSAHCIQRFAEAVGLYHGDFLQGLLLKENPLFEEWVLFLREQSHRQAMAMLTALTTHAIATRNYALAQEYAARQVQLEPWHEEAHRQLMLALAAQGQTTAALRQYESCRRTLESELGVSPAVETVKLYERIRTGDPLVGEAVLQGLPITAPNAATEDNQLTATAPSAKALHNLPPFLPPLFGRETQLAHLRTLVEHPGKRLITIAGLGGMGKTRLGLALLEQLATEQPPAFSAGIWFVPLVGISASVDDLPALLARTALDAMGVTIAGHEDRQNALYHYLAPRRLLLLLDNVEHLLLEEATASQTTAFLLALLQAAPQVTLLLTSRVSLQLLAETVVRLEGLPVPSMGETVTAIAEANYAGIELFTFHAQRAVETFTLDGTNLSVVSELCRRLGGMPLALELAATLVPHFTCTDLLAEIRQNLTVLASARRDMDLRHRQLSAVLESVWQQLLPREQQILAQSSIFVGRFSRAAAQAVTGATVADLTSLTNKSIFQLMDAGEYQLHPLLQHFAGTMLGSTEQAVWATADRHSHYYLHFVATHSEAMARHAPRQTAAAIQSEYDNIRQAWHWTVTQLAEREEEALWTRIDHCAHTLHQFYLFSCRYAEGIAAFRHAAAGVQAGLIAGDLGRKQRQLHSKLLAFEASLLCFQGDSHAGRTLAEEVVVLSTTCGSRAGLVLGLNAIGHTCYITGDYAAAKGYFHRILTILEEGDTNAANGEVLPNDFGDGIHCMSYLYLGAVAKTDDDFEQAAHYFRQAWQLSQALGKVMAGLDARMNLADLARSKQRYAAAKHDYEEVVQIAGELSNRRAEGIARYELADVLRGLGEYSKALAQFMQALAIFGEIGDPVLETFALAALGALYSDLGDYERANQYLQEALQRSEPLSAPDAKPTVWLATALFLSANRSLRRR